MFDDQNDSLVIVKERTEPATSVNEEDWIVHVYETFIL